jgi:hypothetical protein
LRLVKIAGAFCRYREDDAFNVAGNCSGAFEIGKRSMMELLERRKEPRYLCFGQVKLNRLPGLVRTGRIIDLSLSGCLIEVRLPVYVSEGCAVELALQMKGIALRMLGEVTFVGNPRPGLVGISFVRLSERGQIQLREVIAELGLTPSRNRNRLSSLKRRRGW